MILRQIHLTNYKCFQDLCFTLPVPNRNRFLTVVVGPNGSGKTNLLRALRWCLYGERAEVGPELLYYPRAASLDEGSAAETSVSLILEENGHKISIERLTAFSRNKSEVFQICASDACSSLTVKHIHNDTTSIEEDPQSFVEEIVPESVFHLIAVDGERLVDPAMLLPRLMIESTSSQLVRRVLQRLKNTALAFEIAGAHLQKLERYAHLTRRSISVAESLAALSDRRAEKQAKDYSKRIREIDDLAFDVEIEEIRSDGTVVGRFNGNIETLSEGQLSVFVLKSILLSLSGLDHTLPLILDAPFGRLSDSNIVHCVSKIAHLMRGTQIVLLMTDYEYERAKKHLESILLAEFRLTTSRDGSSLDQSYSWE